MNNNEYYIHYQYLNFAPQGGAHLAAVYNDIKVGQKYQESLELLNMKVKEKVKSQLPKGTNLKDEQYFELLEDFRNEVLSPAAQKMVESIQTTKMSRTDLSQATKSVEEIQKVINIFTKITEQILNSSFERNPLPVLTLDLLNGQNLSANEIKYKYREMYLADKTAFKVDDSYSRAIASHQKDVNSILANLSALKSISQGGMSNFSQKIQSDTVKTLLWSTYFRLNKIVGFVSQDTLAGFIPEYIKNNLGISDDNFKIMAEGTKSSEMFKTRTEDVSVEMDFKGMLSGKKKGEVRVALPGVTLKRTNIKNGNVAHVNIKTNALLGNFLGKLDGSNLIEFYQAYADYNMALLIGGKKYPAQLKQSQAKGGMEMMYNYMHAFMLPYALAGALTANDLAYYMIINNQVYTVPEIMEKITDKNDYSFVISNLSSSQAGIKNQHQGMYKLQEPPHSDDEEERKEKKYQRSNEIINKIHGLKINMQLMLKLS